MSNRKKLTPIEERIFAYQMSFDHIGLEGQERIINTDAVVLGLSAIGLAAVRVLVSAGFGKIRIIDNSTVTETTLGAQSTFGPSDLGKVKALALKEKELGRSHVDKLDIFATQLTKKNASLVLPPDCKIVIDTSFDLQVTSDIFDIADERGLHVAGAVANGWEGVFGVYASPNKQLRDTLYQYYYENTDIGSDKCLSVSSFCLGGLLTSLVIRDVLNFDDRESKLFKCNFFTQEVTRIL